MIMKRAAIIFVVVFAAGIIMSSCSKEVCPAMSDLPDDTTENVHA